MRHDLDFDQPGTPTVGPWWVHITGCTPQPPAPVTLTKDAVTLYDTNTMWGRMSHRYAEGDLAAARDLGDTLQEYDTSDRRGNPLRVVLHIPDPDGMDSQSPNDGGGVYVFAR
ncbi:hypothetical protein ACFPH6_44540 [Streptomyces xiangluensis]|uniref:Uncharacterized protein n=1 Tax=Streptomyces xiangluensis TaxID=2665720 RepID=A0ABV8Z3U3_9ACTN